MAIDIVDTAYFLCPRCTGNKLHKAGFSTVWKAGAKSKVQRYQCQDCGLLTIVPGIVSLDVNKLTPEGKHSCHCLRCDHTWISDNIHPVRCAKCKSPYWDRVNIVGKAGIVAEVPGVNKEE